MTCFFIGHRHVPAAPRPKLDEAIEQLTYLLHLIDELKHDFLLFFAQARPAIHKLLLCRRQYYRITFQRKQL